MKVASLSGPNKSTPHKTLIDPRSVAHRGSVLWSAKAFVSAIRKFNDLGKLIRPRRNKRVARRRGTLELPKRTMTVFRVIGRKSVNILTINGVDRNGIR